MGFLDRILRRGGSTSTVGLEAETPAEASSCPHLSLSPKWDNADDIGKEDLASSFECARPDYSAAASPRGRTAGVGTLEAA